MESSVTGFVVSDGKTLGITPLGVRFNSLSSRRGYFNINNSHQIDLPSLLVIIYRNLSSVLPLWTL